MSYISKFLIAVICLITINSHADKTIATYGNGKTITNEEITKWVLVSTGGKMPMNKKSFADLDKELQKDILKKYAVQQEIVSIAKNSSIQKSDAFQYKLELAKNSLMVTLFLEKYADRHVNDMVLKEQYKKFIKTLKDSDDLEVSHILLVDEATANNVYKKLKKGEKFSDLAVKYSKDESTRNKKGKLGKISRGQILPQYEKVAYGLSKGKYSAPVQTEMGWFIIKLDNRTKKDIPTFKAVKPQLEMMAKNEIIKNYMQKLASRTTVKLKD